MSNYKKKMQGYRFRINSIFKEELLIYAESPEEALRNLHISLQEDLLEAQENEDFAGVVIEKMGVVLNAKAGDDCDRDCKNCLYWSPEDGRCTILDDEPEPDLDAELDEFCEECGQRYDEKIGGTCGDDCDDCEWQCPNCFKCTHPEGKKRKKNHYFSK